MRLRLQYEPQFFSFGILTDAGAFSAPTNLLAIPKSCLEPLSIANNSLTESDDWTFEIYHREVAAEDGSTPTNRVVFPDEFRASLVSRDMTRLEDAPGVIFKECKYKVTLNDGSIGERKASIRVVDKENRMVVETPVVWERSPYISATPTRVAIAMRPARVFLRCRDESVELSRVLSSPGGIKAVISSARELTVMPGENAPEVISGIIEVATTARGRPPLRVPVVRYAPRTRQAKDDTPKGRG